MIKTMSVYAKSLGFFIYQDAAPTNIKKKKNDAQNLDYAIPYVASNGRNPKIIYNLL